MKKAKSITLLEYPHSLSYQETTLAKLSFKEIPADSSKMEDLQSWMKSELTTASEVYPKIPFNSPSEAFLMAAQMS